MSGTVDDCDLTGRGQSTELRYWDEAPLDPQTPVATAPITGADQGGLMFVQRFEAFGDATGWLLPGDSGGPLFATTASGARVVGVASMQACDKHAGCTGGKQGALENLWARSMDARSGNVAMLRALAQNPDGSLWGDDVAAPGCDATPPVSDPDDPDCDRVLTLPRAWQPRDNCPAVYNPDQRDADGDGVGDACEASAFHREP